MPFEILEKSICYTTFLTKKETSQQLLRCSRCRCAWYKSREHQRANWNVHKEVCKRPEYEKISKMNATQCMEALQHHTAKCDHNTAAMFERLFDLMRNAADRGSDSVNGEQLSDLGLYLHSFSRLQWPGYLNPTSDYLEGFYERAWACPGMPQLLFFSDLRSSTYRRIMKDYPEGRPSFDNEDDECNFDFKYDSDSDLSGEDVSWFVIGFLVRSCVWGSLSLASNHDGRGNLRNTGYAVAALHRVVQIFSTKITRDSTKKALYPVPGLILNVAENKRKVFLHLMEMGVGPAILEWADQDYGKETIEIMTKLDMGTLSDHVKLDLLEICLNVFNENSAYPWVCMDSEKDAELVKLCLKLCLNLLKTCSDLKGFLETGMHRRPEMSKQRWNHKDGGRIRIVIAFIYEKMISGGDLGHEKTLKTLLEEWGKMEMWEKTKYAEKVMEVKELRAYEKVADEIRQIILKRKLKSKCRK